VPGTFVDSSVLLDVYTEDQRWLEWSEAALRDALTAGHAHAAYRRAGRERTQILADFLIGAHAAVTHRPLLTRDPRRVSQHLPGVELIAPSAGKGFPMGTAGFEPATSRV
jgi:hypothetical protein